MAAHLRLGGVRRASFPTDLTLDAPTPHEGEAILRHLVDFLDAFMWQADPRTMEITFVTDGVREMLGHPVEVWLGGPRHWGENIHREDRKRVIDSLRATAHDGADRDVEFRVRAAGGEIRTLRHAVRLVTPPSGENELWGVTTDVTGARRTAEALQETRDRYRALSAEAAEFRRRSLEDPLTRLANRVLFQERLDSTIRAAQRSGGRFAILLVDLDRFKELNDTYGHQAGDSALTEFAIRFRICLRGQDTAARIGGDEFAAVLPATHEAGATRVAERIVNAMHDPLQSVEGDRVLGASIGIAIFPEHGSTSEELLARADAAMYRAKSGGCGYAVATGELVPRRLRPRRRAAARVIIGIAAALAFAAGGLNTIAHRRDHSGDSAARLVEAAAVLANADGGELAALVTDVEQTLEQIPWGEVVKVDVVSALSRLERMLSSLRSDVDGELVARVEKLIASIRHAETVARLSARLPKSGTTTRPRDHKPPQNTSPDSAQPTVVATPLVVPTPVSPSLP